MVAIVIWIFVAKGEQFAWFSKIVQVLSEISKGCRDGNQIWIHNQMDSCSVRKFASTLHPQKYSLSGGFARGWRYETNRCKYWTGQVKFSKSPRKYYEKLSKKKPSRTSFRFNMRLKVYKAISVIAESALADPPTAVLAFINEKAREFIYLFSSKVKFRHLFLR